MATFKPVLTLAIGLSLGAFSQPGSEDHQRQPELVEGAYAFNCPNIRATVRYRQERREPEGAPRDEDLRVTLLELTVAGARLPADQFASAGEVFRSFAWVHYVSALCYRGRVTISVQGMPHRLFFDFLRDRGPPPVHVSSSINLSASGVERIFPFDPRDATAPRD